jgi:GntR family transcriptional regulator
MIKKLNNESVIPLYYQLKELIKENIENGDWLPGDKIPSEYQLISEYNISRNTVKKALEDLVQDGLLYRVQGKGTFVSKPKLEQSLTGFYSFSKVMREKGLNPKDIIISIESIQANSRIARKLQIPENAEVIELRRLRCANEEPIILETSYLPKEKVEKLNKEDLEKKSLYDILELEYGIIVSKAKEVFEPILIRNFESQLLNVHEGLPALLLERIAFEGNGSPIEFCSSIVRGDRCKFYTELI